MADQSAQVAAAQSDDGLAVAELVAAYVAGVQLLEDSVAGMDLATLRERPIEGQMSSLEVLSHVADCEQFLADRIKRTAATDRPLLVGIDASPYLTVLHYQDRDPELQLRLVEMTRLNLAADLAWLPEDAWTRVAIHTETGLVTMRQLLLHAIRHLEYHVGTILEKRRALGLG
ncbi:MAG: DinB family protein [Coriobacteriia bacterium]|nr:DinB family protein [Coriobacteriia bacterium]